MPNEEKFNQLKYVAQYQKDHYHTFRVSVPKEKRSVVENLTQSTGKSINRLFIEALEKQHNVDLTNIESHWKKEVRGISKRLEDLASSKIKSDDISPILSQSINELRLVEELAGEYEVIRNPKVYEKVEEALSYLNYALESKVGDDEIKELLKKSAEHLDIASKF